MEMEESIMSSTNWEKLSTSALSASQITTVTSSGAFEANEATVSAPEIPVVVPT